jgi:hypothetical protein
MKDRAHVRCVALLKLSTELAFMDSSGSLAAEFRQQSLGSRVQRSIIHGAKTMK